MGLLDYDDWEILKQAGILKGGRKPMRSNAIREDEQRFADLQNLGHKENSADFSDSPFADRKRCEKCDANDRDQFGKCIHEI